MTCRHSRNGHRVEVHELVGLPVARGVVGDADDAAGRVLEREVVGAAVAVGIVGFDEADLSGSLASGAAGNRTGFAQPEARSIAVAEDRHDAQSEDRPHGVSLNR